MTAHELETLALVSTTPSTDKEEEYSIPLDIFDIITICREYNKLGWQMQNQVESILEVGIEESIKTGTVKQQSLPHIKDFLNSIRLNPYFGDAGSQAYECMQLIAEYEDKHEAKLVSSIN